MTDAQKWLLFAGVAAGGWLIYLLAPVLTPFASAALLAYLFNPVVERIVKLKLSRTLAVILVFFLMLLIFLLLVLLLVPLAEKQISSLINRLPAYIEWLQQTALPWIQARMGTESVLDLEVLKQGIFAHWKDAGGVMTDVLAGLSRSGAVLLGWLANLVLIPVVSFYLLRDWNSLVTGVRGLLPRGLEPVIADLTREADVVLGAFLRGQLLVMLILGALYSIGLGIAGLELAFLIGMTAGLLSFIPYVGVIAGLLLAGTAALFQFQEAAALIPVVIVFGIGQLLESILLTPWLVGDRIGLHPVAVIFAIMAGGTLFGFIGVLLALPVGAVIMVVLRHIRGRYLESPLYADAEE